MTPQEAGLALRDDPTFAAMSDAERHEEAALILGSDDPLDIALAIEIALEAPAIISPAGALGEEPCRLETPCGGREPVAGNGRCMTCGANRQPALAEPEDIYVEAAKAISHGAPRETGKSAVLAMGYGTEPLSARVKHALGLGDKELGDLLGVSRPTAQAYVSGRLVEQVEGVRSEYLLRALDKRAGEIEALRAELRSRLGR